jgi:hypothetical protein
VRLPVVARGAYYLLFQTDRENRLFESDVSNNIMVVSFTFDANPTAWADLAPVAFQVPDMVTGPPHPTVSLARGVTNRGGGVAEAPWGWEDAVFLSTNGLLDAASQRVDQWLETNSVRAGDSYWRTNTVQLPVVEGGTYYLHFRTDVWDSVPDSDRSNNIVVVPFTYEATPPDLAPLAFQVPADITGPPNPSVTLVWGVTNQANGHPGLGRDQPGRWASGRQGVMVRPGVPFRQRRARRNGAICARMG